MGKACGGGERVDAQQEKSRPHEQLVPARLIAPMPSVVLFKGGAGSRKQMDRPDDHEDGP